MSVKIKNNLVNYNPKSNERSSSNSEVQIPRIPTQLPEIEDEQEGEAFGLSSDFSSYGGFADSIREPALSRPTQPIQPIQETYRDPKDLSLSEPKQEISWGSLVIAGVLGCVLGSNLEKIQMANSPPKSILFK